MRKCNPQGRAIVKSFSYPKNKDDLMLKIEELARREGLSFSDVIMAGLEKWWLEHGDSQNPQTKISLFESGLENAIPNMYEIIQSPEKLDKFYSLLKSKEEYEYLDKAVNVLVNTHNKKLKEFD